MDDAEKALALRGWATSRLEKLRGAFKGLRLLCLLPMFSWTDKAGQNPLWPGMRFPGPGAYKPEKVAPPAAEADQLLTRRCADLARLQVCWAPASLVLEFVLRHSLQVGRVGRGGVRESGELRIKYILASILLGNQYQQSTGNKTSAGRPCILSPQE